MAITDCRIISGVKITEAHRQAQAMTSLFGDPTHLRKRAEEMRKIADGMRDDRSKHLMRQIADDYERLAKRVEERAKLK